MTASPHPPAPTSVDVAVVGAGAAATLVLTALRRSARPPSVALIGRGHPPGRGVAYSTTDPGHLMNVPARRLSLDPADPDDLVRWLDGRVSPSPDPEAYIPRALFGDYATQVLARATGGEDRRPPVPLIEDAAVRLTRQGDGWRVALRGGPALTARTVVLATGPPPGPPPVTGPDHPRVVADPWAPGALAGLTGHRHVVAVGTGLTTVDVALTLTTAGARVTAVSRHGDLPHPHPAMRRAPARPLPATLVLPTAAAVRRHLVEAARREPHGWEAAVDGFRDHLDRLWASLPPGEQAKLLRRGAPTWSTHRHRMAPEVGRALHRLVADGRLRVHRGRPVVTRADDTGVEVAVHHRGTVRRLHGDALVLCTGPLADVGRTTDPLLRHLLDTGRATLGPHRLGLAVDPCGAVVDARGHPDPTLLTIGALRRGTWAETTAIPELRAQAVALVPLLAPGRARSGG